MNQSRSTGGDIKLTCLIVLTAVIVYTMIVGFLVAIETQPNGPLLIDRIFEVLLLLGSVGFASLLRLYWKVR